ncbi:hypothetical protein [Chryseobacterium sp.]|uniref:hypothetical protein n=1 Tax=Chryseobacterium sp. TaxID=1871047 RepID=UPI000EE62745|nr:hypothetical protein [Chryseobacterium sp.]HCA05909.1 hypothetical protein [Chryseobacterium sp.]
MYKEFGFWKEYGGKYQNFSSVNLYINEEENALYDKDKLINYLNSGGIVAATSSEFSALIYKRNKIRIFFDIDGRNLVLA